MLAGPGDGEGDEAGGDARLVRDRPSVPVTPSATSIPRPRAGDVSVSSSRSRWPTPIADLAVDRAGDVGAGVGRPRAGAADVEVGLERAGAAVADRGQRDAAAGGRFGVDLQAARGECLVQAGDDVGGGRAGCSGERRGDGADPHADRLAAGRATDEDLAGRRARCAAVVTSTSYVPAIVASVAAAKRRRAGRRAATSEEAFDAARIGGRGR